MFTFNILHLVVLFFVVLCNSSLRCNAVGSDIDCLRSIKESLADPLGILAFTWKFDNLTEGFICKFAGIQCWHPDENKVLSISAIPVSLANCHFLNNLKLENNKLEGQIPPGIGLLGRLKTFNVANNMLTGPVPRFINANFPAESYANNPGLCGEPLEPCVAVGNHHFLFKTVLSRRVLFVCGFVTGWSLSTLVGIYLFFLGLPGVKKILLLIKNRTKVMVIAGNEWPLEEVNNDPKRFHVSEDLEEEFVSEIKTLGSLRHPNLLPLIGFCSKRNERLLVYKYMSNGNLHEWLHSTDDNARLLDFPLRVKIIVGVAKALAWLHDGGNFHVVHSNISSQCILLDENFDPKLSNFWEATLAKTNDIDSNLSLLPIVESFDFTTYKKDVYRFGVVLLELLTRKESYELSCSSLNLSSSSFAGPLDVDKLLLGQGFDDMVMQLLEPASNCMKFIPDQRPTMLQVYLTVAAIARVHDQTGNPEIQLHVD
ncbi:putative d-3-phosphoglycerate dehydrogenase, chloroplastic-like [Capsicum annuum]|nr:putative d-3-phosphoglycerate dehydrogenase, chloroplastic-like [Capsicum annuum]